MSPFKHPDSSHFLRSYITSLPKKGRGEASRMAKHLGISTTLISQIFGGNKDLSLEMADQLIEFFGLNAIEGDFFILLVEHQRAGTDSLRKRWQKKIREFQERASLIKNRVEVDAQLSDVTKSIFYSHWLYSAVRNLTAIDAIQDIDSLSAHLKIPAEKLLKVVHFLVEHQLCVNEKQTIITGGGKNR